MRFLPILFFVIFFSCDVAKNLELPEDQYFIKYFGDDGNQRGVDLETDANGNIYLLGTSDSIASIDGKEKKLFLVKVDPKGNLIWKITFGKSIDDARDLLLTTDNKLVVLANTVNDIDTKRSSDIYIAILDNSGNLIRSTTFYFQLNNQSLGYDEIGYSITQTNDGFIVAGSTTFVESKVSSGNIAATDLTDGLQLRFFSDLSLYPNLWRQKNGSEFQDVIVKVIQNDNGSFKLFGFTNKPLPNESSNAPSYFKFWVRSLNSFGETPGSEVLINDATNDLILNSVIPITNGYLLAGQNIDATGSKVYISKLNNNLEINFGIKTPSYDTKIPLMLETKNVAIATNLDADYYLLANDASNSNNTNWHLNKIQSNGNNAWVSPIYFGGDNEDTIGSIVTQSDGKLLMVGTMSIGGRVSEKKMALIKVNSSGKFAK